MADCFPLEWWGGAAAASACDEGHLALARLTPKEHDVLGLLCAGKSVKEMAHLLGVTPQSICDRKRSLMNKLGLPTEFHLIVFAVRHGLISSD
jgi:DNA-binding NarL/FixJ family response regulator